MHQNAPVRHPYFKITKRFVQLDQQSWHLKLLESEKIKAITTGKGQKVAVIDSGVDGNHPELFGKVILKLDRTGEGFQAGEHGTFVAGEIAGQNVGLFPDIKIGDFKSLTSVEGLGDGSWVAQCIRDCIKEKYDVINASIGSNFPDPQIKEAILEYTNDKHNFFIAASGNDGKGTHNEMSTDYPGKWANEIDGVISVGACGLDKKGNIYIPTWSSRGSVTIMAPGVDIVGILPNGEYGIMSGTSMATPLVAATIAAVKSIYPSVSHSDIPFLFASSVDLHLEGFDNVTGHGLISIIQILNRAKELNSMNPNKEKEIPKEIKKKRGFFRRVKRLISSLFC